MKKTILALAAAVVLLTGCGKDRKFRDVVPPSTSSSQIASSQITAFADAMIYPSKQMIRLTRIDPGTSYPVKRVRGQAPDCQTNLPKIEGLNLEYQLSDDFNELAIRDFDGDSQLELTGFKRVGDRKKELSPLAGKWELTEESKPFGTKDISHLEIKFVDGFYQVEWEKHCSRKMNDPTEFVTDENID